MLVKAVVMPHPPIAISEVGRGEEERIRETLDAYERAGEEIAGAAPETIIVASPHAAMYADWFNVSAGSGAHGDMRRFGAAQVKFDVTYDEEFTGTLNELCAERGFPAGTGYDRDPVLDHGTMVPLYFVRRKYSDFRLVRIGLSGLSPADHYRFGQIIREVTERLDRRLVFIASGDLAHCQKKDGPYGLAPEGPEYDRRIMDTLGRAAFGELLEYDPLFLEKSMECGHRSFCIMAGALDRTAVVPHVLSHQATFGVGYGIVVFDAGARDDERDFLDRYRAAQASAMSKKAAGQDAYVRLARASLVSWIRDRRRLDVPRDLPEEMLSRRAGAFVSIHENGELRGCIGTIMATRANVAEEIIDNAVAAAARDPRFAPIRRSELPYLDISVDVLGEPEEIDEAAQLDVKRYGVICQTADGRRGLLLPDLDGIDTVEEQIRTACRKGGIDPRKDKVSLKRFEVVRHE